ncbi:hypothetical protein SAMN02745121_02543 [Nannocystis exedens]|uniref:Uncharacterized protein n=1 Tax=Nannocystis exedens TaxID=54 RepID=A0A1I1WUY0_9BACT|nr:hypothetical protein NAEX_04056 [Nannocystis exedens]SFD98821.1 hypothetical protein SAMN02745121_02543 [Nannocystis exedens]
MTSSQLRGDEAAPDRCRAPGSAGLRSRRYAAGDARLQRRPSVQPPAAGVLLQHVPQDMPYGTSSEAA